MLSPWSEKKGVGLAGPDVRQVGGACTSAQLRNITLCCQLNEVHRSLVSLLPRLPAHAAAALKCAPLLTLSSLGSGKTLNHET